jgi:hypothetical protein
MKLIGYTEFRTGNDLYDVILSVHNGLKQPGFIAIHFLLSLEWTIMKAKKKKSKVQLEFSGTDWFLA